MGLFNDRRHLTESVPAELLETGLLGRGIIVSIQQTSVGTGVDFDPAHVCVFTVDVALDKAPRYTATCRQAVRATILPKLMMPATVIAVRIDPRDHRRIALSLGEPPPTMATARSGDPNTWSASRILELGVPCKAEIVDTQPLGIRNTKGDDMYAFTLTVTADGRPPYRIQLGNSVPAAAVPLLYPGNTVPAKRIPDGDDRELVIDWEVALAQLAATATA